MLCNVRVCVFLFLGMVLVAVAQKLVNSLLFRKILKIPEDARFSLECNDHGNNLYFGYECEFPHFQYRYVSSYFVEYWRIR